MNNPNLKFLRIAFAMSDTVVVNLCLFISYQFFKNYSIPPASSLVGALVISSVIWLLATTIFSLYNEHIIIKQKYLFRATWRSIVVYMLLFHAFCIAFNYVGYNLTFLLSFYVLLMSSFLLSRVTYTLLEDFMIRNYAKEGAVNVLAIASIGGHWVQLLRLMPLFKVNDVSFISTKASLEDTVEGYKYYSVPDANRNNKLNLIICCLSIGWRVLFSRPQIIITTGAAPGLFGIVVGRILGIKTVWIDSMANVEKLSLSGNIALKIADRVYTQWEHLSTPKVVFAGNILEE